MKNFRIIGLIGLSATLIVNLVAWLILKRPKAEFFSTAWWSIWFSNYIVWSVFAIAGFAGGWIKRR